MKAIFLSDVHLRDGTSVKTNLVIRFLQEVASQHDRIFILGDLFDVWPGTSPFLVQTFAPVLHTLRELVKKGIKIDYVEGNHDFHLGEYFTHELKIKVHPDFYVEDFNGQSVYMTHGDLGNPKDRGYRALRKVLRSPLMKKTLSIIPGKFIHRVGANSSNLSRQYQAKHPHVESQIRQTYREAAESLFRRGFDMVIMGHTHLPDDYRFDLAGRPRRYVNLGDWVSHFSYLVFDGDHFYTKSHPVKHL